MFVRQSCDVQYLVLHIVHDFQCLICNACACNNCIMDNITQQCFANLVDRNNNLKPFATITCDSQMQLLCTLSKIYITRYRLLLYLTYIEHTAHNYISRDIGYTPQVIKHK